MQAGRQAARVEMNAQLEAVEAGMARSIQEMSGLRQRFRQEAEEDVVALALAIARRILHRELTMAPDARASARRRRRLKNGRCEVHRVRVSPEDAPLVKQHLDKMGLPQRVDVTGGPTLEREAILLDRAAVLWTPRQKLKSTKSNAGYGIRCGGPDELGGIPGAARKNRDLPVDRSGHGSWLE